eukprot:1137545-Pelagomonas_calceolata.AAC.4
MKRDLQGRQSKEGKEAAPISPLTLLPPVLKATPMHLQQIWPCSATALFVFNLMPPPEPHSLTKAHRQ